MIVKLGFKAATKKFICPIQFPNKQIGEVAGAKVIPMSEASHRMLLNQNFRKTGYEVQANFEEDVRKVMSGEL